jgi:hypothetical protein
MMKKGDDDDDEHAFVVKNLDTGETLDIDEASIKFSVMGLERARYHSSSLFTSHHIPSSAKDEDKSSCEFNIYQQISEEDEDYYFDAFLEGLKMELDEQRPDPVQIPTGARLHFLRICGYEVVTDDENRKFCVFILEVHCNIATPTKWKIYRRYSEFRKLNDALRAEGFYVPVMPPKTVFNSFTEEFISKRKVPILLVSLSSRLSGRSRALAPQCGVPTLCRSRGEGPTDQSDLSRLPQSWSQLPTLPHRQWLDKIVVRCVCFG